MDFTYKLLKKGLDSSMLRQEVTMHNISNVNTHGYKAKRVDFERQLQTAVKNHKLNGTKANYSLNNLKPTVTRDRTKVGRDGNSVDLNEEMINLSTNQIYYNGLVNQVNKKVAIRRYVINGGR